MTKLIQLTDKLLKKCDDAQARFFEAREKDVEFDFFEVVKPYADETRDELTEWKQLMIAFIDQNQPKNLYIQQIDHTIDALEQFVVQSFYKKTSKKRFLQSIQSVKYTLSIVKHRLDEGEQDATKATND